MNAAANTSNGTRIAASTQELPELQESENIVLANMMMQRQRFASREINENRIEDIPAPYFNASGGSIPNEEKDHEGYDDEDDETRPTLQEALGVLEDVSSMTNSIGNLVFRLQMEELRKSQKDRNNQSRNRTPKPSPNLTPGERSTQESSEATDDGNEEVHDSEPRGHPVQETETANLVGGGANDAVLDIASNNSSRTSGELRIKSKRKRDEQEDDDTSSNVTTAATAHSEAREEKTISQDESSSQPAPTGTPDFPCSSLPTSCNTAEGPDALQKRLRRMAATLLEIQQLQKLFIAGIRRS